MDRLREGINETLTAHLAEHGGGMVLRFHLIAEYIDPEGDEGWLYVTPEDQRQSQTMGLIEFARGVAFHEQQRYLDQISEG